MRLTRLAARSFRNLVDFELDTQANFVVFHGANAMGKTNVLEAIYYLATLKPLRGRRPRELIRFGAADATVFGRVESGGISRAHRVDFGPARKLQVDGKSTSVDTWFESVRAIAFRPADGEIVSGEPARRRRWVDRAAFTADPVHLGVVRNYKRALDQKAAALKSEPSDEVLDVLDVQIARYGAQLAARREDLLRTLGPHVRMAYASIVGSEVAVSLQYRSVATGETLEERQSALAMALGNARPQERRRRICVVGPQKDDVVIEIDGQRARTYGSRGQIRSIVLAMKLAEMRAARDRGEVPLFLIDDVSSELDRTRTAHLVQALDALDAQVFVTTTDPRHLEQLPVEATTHVEVRQGTLLGASSP